MIGWAPPSWAPRAVVKVLPPALSAGPARACAVEMLVGASASVDCLALPSLSVNVGGYSSDGKSSTTSVSGLNAENSHCASVAVPTWAGILVRYFPVTGSISPPRPLPQRCAVVSLKTTGTWSPKDAVPPGRGVVGGVIQLVWRHKDWSAFPRLALPAFWRAVEMTFAQSWKS